MGTISIFNPTLYAKEWVEGWEKVYTKFPDKENWIMNTMLPNKECYDEIRKLINPEKIKHLVIFFLPVEQEGTFTEEEKRQITRIFGPYQDNIENLKNGTILDGGLRYMANLLLQKESEFARNYGSIVKRAFNVGNRYESQIIESMDVLGENYFNRTKLQLELELSR